MVRRWLPESVALERQTGDRQGLSWSLRATQRSTATLRRRGDSAPRPCSWRSRLATSPTSRKRESRYSFWLITCLAGMVAGRPR
jgi:hypothetical protein